MTSPPAPGAPVPASFDLIRPTIHKESAPDGPSAGAGGTILDPEFPIVCVRSYYTHLGYEGHSIRERTRCLICKALRAANEPAG